MYFTLPILLRNNFFIIILNDFINKMPLTLALEFFKKSINRLYPIKLFLFLKIDVENNDVMYGSLLNVKILGHGSSFKKVLQITCFIFVPLSQYFIQKH